MYPWSSSGRKLEGSTFPQKTAITANAATANRAIAPFRINPWQARTYRLVPLSNLRLNQAKNFASGPWVVFLGPEKQRAKRRA